MENFNEENIPEEYRTVSLWKYVGIMALSCIPCVGLICLIVFACGAVKNKNIINFARANLVIIGIVVLLYVLLMVFGIAGSIVNNAQQTILNSY